MNSGNEFGTENSVRMGDGGIVEAIVANHFEMFVRNMNNETHNKLNSWDGFDNEFVVLVPVVVKRNKGAGVRIDEGSGNHRPAKVTANVFGNDRRITVIGFSVDIKAFTMILVNSRLDLFRRRTKPVMQAIQENRTESVL